MAGRLKNILRIKDTIARIAGDEFVIVMENVNQVSYVEIVADKIVKELDRPFVIDNQQVQISGSVGITLYPFEDIGAERVLNQADTAMYHAKRTGKNRFSFYYHGM
jgi:diguanylate cyclase (GGDEF)-like protein